MLTMKHYQAIIRQNRKLLADLYEFKQNCKELKSACDEDGDTVSEYFYHNEVKRLSKQIAALVEIQKALKDTVRSQVMFQRTVRKYKVQAAERRESLRESVLKRVAMDSVGEV